MEQHRPDRRAVRGAAATSAWSRASAARRSDRASSHAVRGVLAAAVIVALLAAGCGGGDGDSGSGGGDSPADGASTALGSADDGVGSALLLADRNASLEMTRSFWRPPVYYQTLKECMSAQGFEYLEPLPPGFIIPFSEMAGILEEVAALDPTSSRYRNRYGYGVSTVNAYLNTLRPADEDPNWELLDAMSDSERQAWRDALRGPIGEGTFDPLLGGDVVEITESGGCEKEAEDAAGIEWDWTGEESRAREEGWQRIRASEGFVELEEDWSRCAAEQGYEDLVAFSDVYGLIRDKLTEILAPDPFANLTEDDLAGLSDEEWDELYEQQNQRYTLEDLAVVQQEELEIAARLADCDRAYWTGFAELEDRLDPTG